MAEKARATFHPGAEMDKAGPADLSQLDRSGRGAPLPPPPPVRVTLLRLAVVLAVAGFCLAVWALAILGGLYVGGYL